MLAKVFKLFGCPALQLLAYTMKVKLDMDVFITLDNVSVVLDTT
jgi:hypothetical protein